MAVKDLRVIHLGGLRQRFMRGNHVLQNECHCGEHWAGEGNGERANWLKVGARETINPR